MIRKLKSGEFRLYSRKKDAKSGRRKNLGTFAPRDAAEKRRTCRAILQAIGGQLLAIGCTLPHVHPTHANQFYSGLDPRLRLPKSVPFLEQTRSRMNLKRAYRTWPARSSECSLSRETP